MGRYEKKDRTIFGFWREIEITDKETGEKARGEGSSMREAERDAFRALKSKNNSWFAEYIPPIPEKTQEKTRAKPKTSQRSSDYGHYGSSSASYSESSGGGLDNVLIFLASIALATALMINSYQKKHKELEPRQIIEYPKEYITYGGPSVIGNKKGGGLGEIVEEIPKRTTKSIEDRVKNKPENVGLVNNIKNKEVTHVNEFLKSKGVYPEKKSVDIYRNILPSSQFAKSSPKGYAPIIKEVKDGDGNITSQKAEYWPKKKLEKMVTTEIGITYPQTGNYYIIERSRYPEFYKTIDLNGDGKISSYEIGEFQFTFNKITKKYPEGDLESVVDRFLLKTSIR